MDAADHGMRQGAAHEGQLPCARGPQIGDEFALATEVAVILPPQAYVCIAAIGSAAAAAAWTGFITWEEVGI